jgi:hypothetical protein
MQTKVLLLFGDPENFSGKGRCMSGTSRSVAVLIAPSYTEDTISQKVFCSTTATHANLPLAAIQ